MVVCNCTTSKAIFGVSTAAIVLVTILIAVLLVNCCCGDQLRGLMGTLMGHLGQDLALTGVLAWIRLRPRAPQLPQHDVAAQTDPVEEEDSSMHSCISDP